MGALVTTLRTRGGSAPAPAPFDPETLFSGSNGEWWETGDMASVFASESGTGAPPADGGTVGNWSGKRGLFDWSVASGQPIYESTGNFIRFFDSKYFQNTGFTIQQANQDFSIVTVFKWSSTTATSDGQLAPRIMDAVPASVNMMTTLGSTAGAAVATMTVNGNTKVSGAASPVAATEWQAFTACASSAGSTAYWNDASGANLVSPASTEQPTSEGGYYAIGAGANSNPELHVKMVLAIRRKLTVEEIANIYAYGIAL